MWADTAPELLHAARELGMHNPPALIWFDADGTMHRRCVTDEPNPHCNGCREAGTPTGDYYRWEPPASETNSRRTP